MKDYCSFAPDRLFKYDLSKACDIHDNDYSIENLTYEARLKADKKFYKNIKKASNRFIASIYYIGVRIFGYIYQVK